MAQIRVGLVGVGKIAREQHIPVIAAAPEFTLAASCGDESGASGVENYPTVEDMLTAHPDIDAVAVAAPTPYHYRIARAALLAKKHVLLEKPPCATMTELRRLEDLARDVGCSFFQTWHLRSAPLVGDVHAWLGHHAVRHGHIDWKEDLHVTHPRQDWVWHKGGYGVFDPGINALSVLTAILPEPVFAESAELFFPANCQSPIAAEILLRTDRGAAITASMDFCYKGAPAWDIALSTDGGDVQLGNAATIFAIDGNTVKCQPEADNMHVEYAALYRRFAELIARGASEVDAAPFRLVADIFLVAKHTVVAPIVE